MLQKLCVGPHCNHIVPQKHSTYDQNVP